MAVIQISQEEFEGKINGTNKKVLIDCYAEWCGPCKMISPIIDELSEEIDTCEFYKLNIDEGEEIARKYDIMSIPTILIFKDGNLIDKSVGFRTKEELAEIINK